MGCFKSVEEAREFFKGDRFAATNGIEIEDLYDGGCVCSVKIREDHCNALGSAMGGLVFTLADFAFAVASNNDHRPCVSLDSDIRFLSPSKGSILRAKASLVKSGKTTSVFNVVVTDETGRETALFTGTGYKL